MRKVSGDTTVEYAYDALGRLAAETEFSIGTQVRRDVYTYTAAGDRRTKTTTAEQSVNASMPRKRLIDKAHD